MQNLSPPDTQTLFKNTPSPHALVDVGSAGTEIDDTAADGGNGAHASRSSKKSRLSPAAASKETPMMLSTQLGNTAGGSGNGSASSRSTRNNQSLGAAATSSTDQVANSRPSRSNQKKSPSIQCSGGDEDGNSSSNNNSSSSAMDVEAPSVPAKHTSARRVRGAGSSSSGNGDGGDGAMDVDVDMNARWGMEGQGGHEVDDERLAAGSRRSSEKHGGLDHEGYHQEGDQDQEGGQEGDPDAAGKHCEDEEDADAGGANGGVGDDDDGMCDDGLVYDDRYYEDGDGEGQGGVDDDVGVGVGDDADDDHEYNMYGSIEDDPGNLLVERCQALLWRQLHEYNNLGHLSREENQIKMRLKSAFDRRVSTSILVVGNNTHSLTHSEYTSIHYITPSDNSPFL